VTAHNARLVQVDTMSTPRNLTPSPFLVAEEVAARLRCSLRSIHELTRAKAIPHRKLPGARRCLFREDELIAWEDGADLEVVVLPHGGRVVRPVRMTYAQ
jgi:excisionase family DNA binding protein